MLLIWCFRSNGSLLIYGNKLVLRVIGILTAIDFFLMSEFLHHGSAVNAEQTDRTVIFRSKMGQKLDPKISSPDKRVLDQKGLDGSRVSRFEGGQLFPSV